MLAFHFTSRLFSLWVSHRVLRLLLSNFRAQKKPALFCTPANYIPLKNACQGILQEIYLKIFTKDSQKIRLKHAFGTMFQCRRRLTRSPALHRTFPRYPRIPPADNPSEGK